MEPLVFDKDYFGQTVLHPFGLTAVMVLGFAMLLVPRRHAVVPMLVMACFIAPAQRIAVLTLNFDLLRVMVLFGTVRVLSRQEWRGFRMNRMDWALIAWAISAASLYTLQNGSLEALKFKLGTTYDAIGMYFLFRCLVRELGDVRQIATAFIVISVPVALAFTVEHFSGHNVFAVLGGVPATTLMRDDRLRCQGAFAHPILAGCFWASVMPLIAAKWWDGGTGRWWAVGGLFTSGVVIVMCASSTPVSAVAFAVIAACFYSLRYSMRWVRWGLLAMLVGLHVCMQKPVWHLISRVSFAGGSTGYYRFMLIDATIRHFSEWALVGVQSNASWGAEYGHYLNDITNQYILEGIRGGAMTLALFVVMIALAFGGVGRLWRSVRTPRDRALAWALGVSMFVHCTSFIGVSYFGQINMLWYLTLAMIGSLAASSTSAVAAVSVVQRGRTTAVMHRGAAQLGGLRVLET